MRIALAQTAIVWEEKEQNFKKAEEQIKDAVNRHTEAIFFPEMSFTGFSMNTDATKECGNETVNRVKSLAVQYRMAVGFGWVRDCGGKCENHYTIVDRTGNIISDYVKIHPFSCSGEDLKFRGGSSLSYFSLNGIVCSTFICYDLRFPEIFQAASKKAHAIIVPANWPAKRSGHWQTLLRARAVENQVYILAVNCTGDIGGIHYTGDSCVIDPDGAVQSVLHGGEGILYVELTDDVEDIRRGFPVKYDRREELYKSLE
ncbi:MAG: carbon-nitrogen family hydrolase [Lachnospiraceae bacterium]|nr:carbon-nitrogen family hydrolase [Lachnospiraceae bacterium]